MCKFLTWNFLMTPGDGSYSLNVALTIHVVPSIGKSSNRNSQIFLLEI